MVPLMDGSEFDLFFQALHVPGRNDTVSLEDYVSVFKADSVLVGK